MTQDRNLVIVSPGTTEKIEYPATPVRCEGIYCQPEVDGLRIMTASDTHFLDIVHDSLRKTFANSSIEPSAKLHNAQKSVDFNNPKANEIIRDLGTEFGKNDKLKEGINVLMEAAKHEHYDIKVLKHLLVTASFAKKFIEPPEQKITDAYVELVKISIVYTRLRHSNNLPRLITST